ARLGGFALVWMDYGQIPEAPPFEPSPEPTGGPFRALLVKAPVDAGSFITQCNESADGERVWQTDGSGPTEDMRWAPALYPQKPWESCGDASEEGVYPVVFRNMNAGDVGAWVTQCSDEPGIQHVFRSDGEVDGHPAAVFVYNEPNE